MITISVIIPAYNAEQTIFSTIESVQQQTFQDLEIIVINDGSSDRTFQLLETIKDPRLKVYSYPNGGLPTARNRGITHAKGQYISFIDADDLWTKDKLEKQLAALQANPQAGVAYSWFIMMLEAQDPSQETTFISSKKVNFTDNIYSQLLQDNFIGNGSNILVKREAIDFVGKFDPELESCEDWDYYLRLAAKFSFTLVEEHQIIYRKAPGSMSSKANIMETEGLKVIEKTYQTVSPQLKKQKNKTIAHFSIYCGNIYLDGNCTSKELTKAKQRLFKAIKLDPAIILTKNFYVFVVKILLKQFLPTEVVNNLIVFLKKPFLLKKTVSKN